MKNANKKILAWILILVPAFFIAYHAIINGAFKGWMTTPFVFFPHTYVFLAVIVWLIGDVLLSSTKGGYK